MDKVKSIPSKLKTRQCDLYISTITKCTISQSISMMTYLMEIFSPPNSMPSTGQTYIGWLSRSVSHTKQSLPLWRSWICRWVIVPIVPETPVSSRSWDSIDPEENPPLPNLCNMQKFTTALANNGTLRKINSTNRWVVQEPFVWYIDYYDHSKWGWWFLLRYWFLNNPTSITDILQSYSTPSVCSARLLYEHKTFSKRRMTWYLLMLL